MGRTCDDRKIYGRTVSCFGLLEVGNIIVEVAAILPSTDSKRLLVSLLHIGQRNEEIIWNGTAVNLQNHVYPNKCPTCLDCKHCKKKRSA